MKHFWIIFLSMVLLHHTSIAQKISNVDFDLIKKETTNPNSSNFYSKLVERMEQGDTNLTIEDYAFIYYGHAFQDNYNPYGEADQQEKFMEVYKAQQFNEALKLGEEILKQNPASIKLTFKMMVCAHGIEDTLLLNHYRVRYYSLLEAIYRSGDGASVETALVVNSVQDEYEIMDDLQIRNSFMSQSLSGETDIINFDTSKQDRENKIKTLYFNVHMSMQYMIELFKGIEKKEDKKKRKKKKKKKD